MVDCEIALDLLERSIDVNIQDKKGQTALHVLGFFPNASLGKIIIEKSGKLEIKDEHGNTPLWYAVFYAKGNNEFLELLIGHGANATSKNKAGKTPIDFAIQIKDEKLSMILKKAASIPVKHGLNDYILLAFHSD